MIKVNLNQKRALGIATLLAVVLGTYFLKNYIMLILFAAIVAFMFTPVYNKLMKRGKSSGSAAAITLLITFFSLIIPLALIIALMAFQAKSMIDTINESGISTDLNQFLVDIINKVNQLLESIGSDYRLSESAVYDAIASGLMSIMEALLAGFADFVGSLGSFVSTFIIYIYVFLSILVNQGKIMELLHEMNPLGMDISHLYSKRMGIMTKAMVKGQFIIAFVQGLTDSIMLYIVGFKSLFFFFLVILTVLSIIPLGGGVIVFPVGGILLLTGHIWEGLFLILGHMFIVGNEDNILRPKLVPTEARLDPALTLLSVFSGLAFFGFIGIVLGPVIMIVILTTLQVYLEVYKKIAREEIEDESKSQGKLKKLKFWDKKQAEPDTI